MKTAMYCFFNHGWAPSYYISLPFKERVLISYMAEYEIENRPKHK